MWKVVSIIDTPVITVDEAKTYLRVDHDDEDHLIATLISAAMGAVERYTGRRLQRATIQEDVHKFERRILLRWPVFTLDSVEYIPSGSQTYTSTDIYKVYDTSESRYVYQVPDTTFPSASADVYPVRITYKTGYEAGNVPDQLKQTMYLLLGRMYESRADERQLSQASTTIPTTAEWMMNDYRIKQLY